MGYERVRLFIILALLVIALGTSRVKAEEKSLESWIAQAKTGNLKDRHMALQMLRNVGLSKDRVKTLDAFTKLLLDKNHSVQSLAAAGIRSAGLPTTDKARVNLVKTISGDLTKAKFPRTKPGEAVEVGGLFGAAARAISALEVVGDKAQLPALRKITQNKKIDGILRQLASRAIRAIEKRAAAEEAKQDK